MKPLCWRQNGPKSYMTFNMGQRKHIYIIFAALLKPGQQKWRCNITSRNGDKNEHEIARFSVLLCSARLLIHVYHGPLLSDAQIHFNIMCAILFWCLSPASYIYTMFVSSVAKWVRSAEFNSFVWEVMFVLSFRRFLDNRTRSPVMCSINAVENIWELINAMHMAALRIRATPGQNVNHLSVLLTPPGKWRSRSSKAPRTRHPSCGIYGTWGVDLEAPLGFWSKMDNCFHSNLMEMALGSTSCSRWLLGSLPLYMVTRRRVWHLPSICAMVPWKSHSQAETGHRLAICAKNSLVANLWLAIFLEHKKSPHQTTWTISEMAG